MNTFMNNLKDATDYTYTENGAVAKRHLENRVYDMFATGAAYRNRSAQDCVFLFKQAYDENPELALKCLFWIRDCRGGAGERRFFKECYHWLASAHTAAAARNMTLIPTYGRVDDLYCLVDTPLENDMFEYLHKSVNMAMNAIMTGEVADIDAYYVFKWLKSPNASSKETKRLAKKTYMAFGMTEKKYRQMLSKGRECVKVLETLMSSNRWDEIDFSKIPSKAGINYRKAFERKELIAQKYKEFAASKETKVNADTLFPYEIVKKAHAARCNATDTEKQMIEKYWDNQKDYLNGNPCKMLCVVDTSGSMTWADASVAPIDVAISLGLYCAERIGGPFHNHYISFSRRPQLIETIGVDFIDKVDRIYRTNLCEDTNIQAVFDLLLKIAKQPTTKREDLPDTIVIISDMQINSMTSGQWIEDTAQTEMEKIRSKWAAEGFEVPRLVYWNVDARGDANIIDAGPNVSFVSGFSPVIFQSVLTGKTGWDLCLETLLAKRYEAVK